MNLTELKTEIKKYQYLEDEGAVIVALAAIIATRLQVGAPVWLIVVGESSGGKSQLLRPLALTDEKFIHKVDDLTENTFLSAASSKNGEVSLLKRIGSLGIIVISDLSVIFSKAAEARAAILSQFRMIYDGEMNKHSGTSVGVIPWKGSLGILAGATPSVYRTFEEVSDMGERFMFYRLKAYNAREATHTFTKRKVRGKALDELLAIAYKEYVQEVVAGVATGSVFEIDEVIMERIIDAALFAEKVRTVAHMEWKGQQIDDIPVTAYPMRTVGQLQTIAIGMMIMNKHEGGTGLRVEDMERLEWCAYSLANEKKRRCLKSICSAAFGSWVRTQTVADSVGLGTDVINGTLQVLAAVGVLTRSGDGNGHTWKMNDVKEWDFVRRMEGVKESIVYAGRELSEEDGEENKAAVQTEFASYGVDTSLPADHK